VDETSKIKFYIPGFKNDYCVNYGLREEKRCPVKREYKKLMYGRGS